MVVLCSAIVACLLTILTTSLLPEDENLLESNVGEERVSALISQLEEVQIELGKLKNRSGRLDKETAYLRQRVAEQSLNLTELSKIRQGEGLLGVSTPRVRTSKDASELFQRLSSEKGLGALSAQESAELLDALRALGSEGVAIVQRELGADSREARVLAAALAERLGDPAFTEPLARSALEDDDFLVRRLSSHALASLENSPSADRLAEIFDAESGDAGVRLNAWYGLARQDDSRAVDNFGQLLDGASADVGVDLMIGEALRLRKPKMNPALARALNRTDVGSGTKVMIVRALANDSTKDYSQVLLRLVSDPSTAVSVRKAAKNLLYR